jgi:hypothetical protein
MFVDRKTNMAANSTVYAIYKGFWIRVREFCNGDLGLYSYIYGKTLCGEYDVCKILEQRAYSKSGKRVMWYGQDLALRDICYTYGKDYEVIKERLSSDGWLNSSIYACVIYDKNPFVNYDMSDGGVRYQFRN